MTIFTAMAEKIEKTGKMYYSMGEVAELLDVSASTVRFWEKRFECIRPAKNRHGNRQFSPADVRNLKTIYHLVKERGMTLAGAEKAMRSGGGEGRVSSLGGRTSGTAGSVAGRASGEVSGNGGGLTRDMEIAERLGAIRALLIEVRNELSGGGIIVDNTVAEDVTVVTPEPKPQRVTTPEPDPVEAAEPVKVAATAPAPQPATTPEPDPVEAAEPTPEPSPKPDPGYIEQTLF